MISPAASARRQGGFTLIELLVVIAIIAILIALLVPAVQKVREAAARTQCVNNMKQLAIALHAYHDTYKLFPVGNRSTVAGELTLCTATGLDRSQTREPWTVLVLPFVEQLQRQNKYSFSGTFSSYITDDALPNTTNRTEQQKPLSIFQCPSTTVANADQKPLNNYYGVMGGGSVAPCNSPGNVGYDMSGWVWFNNGILYHNSKISFKNVTDGTSNTFIVGESRYAVPYDPANPTYVWSSSWASGPRTHGGGWNRVFNLAAAMSPINAAAEMTGFGSMHVGGCNMALADGSVRFFNQSMDLAAYRAMGVRNDSQPTGGDY